MHCKTKNRRSRSFIRNNRKTNCIFKGSIYTSRSNNKYKLTIGI